MKKLIISMFALAAVLSSCSKSEVMDSRYENIPISFTTYNGRTPEVKATSVETSTFTKFQVLADLVENSTSKKYINHVYKNESNNKGFIDPLKDDESLVDIYWPTAGDLNFYAFAPLAETATDGKAPVVQLGDNNLLTITIPETIEDQKDVVAATASVDCTEEEEKTAVALNFSHLLSRVHFTINASDFNTDSETKLVVNSLKLSGSFINNATYDFSNLTLATGGEVNVTTGYAYTPSTTEKPELQIVSNAICSYNSTDGEDRYIMILPDQVSDAKIEIEYTLNGVPYNRTGNNSIIIGTQEAPFEFEGNKSYKFNLKLSTKAITFEVEVADWMDSETTMDKELI